MKTLLNFINEALTPEDKERRKELEDLLKKLDYEGYVEKLNEMLKDPRLAEIIKDTFGGPLGTVKLKMTNKNVPVATLLPTQNEIDFGKSLNRGLDEGCTTSIDRYFKEPAELGIPLVTYRQNFIIDGHHRWSQVCCFNRNGEMLCIDFDGGKMSAVEFLKTVQGSIAATLVSQGIDSAQLPVATVKPGMNLLKMSEKEIRNNIEKNITDECVEALSKYVKEVTDMDSAINYLVDNAVTMQKNNPCIDNASARPYMPQTDLVEPRPKGDLNPELKKRLTKTVKIK